MTPRTIVVVGASENGCRFALAAKRRGHEVMLVDEHPQSLKEMSFDAPYFYGAGAPAAVNNANAVAQVFLEARPDLADCLDAGVDVRLSTVVWGAFRNGENAIHIGAPKAGLVSREGEEMVEFDALVVAAGVRDFAPSFRGWELAGVFGAKAGLALLDDYGVFESRRALVLGTSELALRLVKSLDAKGIAVAGVVEPGPRAQAGAEAEAWLRERAIPIHFNRVILEAEGTPHVTAARLVSLGGAVAERIECDCVAIAIATLPNVELPAAMGCRMHFEDALASWTPTISDDGQTSLGDVYYLPPASGDGIVEPLLARLEGRAPPPRGASPPRTADTAAYIAKWIAALHATGGAEVAICQCESVTRGEFLGLEPPRYLETGLGKPQTPTQRSDDPSAPRANLDMTKRMTRVGMGHCQGKRCRDEAAFALAQRYGLPLERLRPASYRFPLRPIDIDRIAADDEPEEIRANWQMWPYETRNA